MVSRRASAKDSIISSGETDPEYDSKLAEAAAKVKQIDRDGNLQTHVYRVVVLGVYLVGAAIIASVLIWMFHFVVPESWRFLSVDAVSKLQNMLFSGAVGSGLTGVFKRIAK